MDKKELAELDKQITKSLQRTARTQQLNNTFSLELNAIYGKKEREKLAVAEKKQKQEQARYNKLKDDEKDESANRRLRKANEDVSEIRLRLTQIEARREEMEYAQEVYKDQFDYITEKLNDTSTTS